MFKDLATKFAAFTCTLVLSATCVLSAVGPASANGQHAVASAARFMA